MDELPIDHFLPEIAEKARNHSALVVVAPPGAGKTTRVPPALLQLLAPEHPHLIMLQPRRVAARASAERIAQEHGWSVGNEVGYHIRFEKRYTERTRLRVVTEGIFTRMLLSDPYLDRIGCVVLDEFHERNLHTDLAAGFLRELQLTVRPELKVVIMSATLEAEPVAKFFGDAPIAVTQGRSFPVEQAYRTARDVRLEELVARGVEEALKTEGDILVFLPGVGEIERTRTTLAYLERDNLLVLPLHGSLTTADQQRALRFDPHHRRVILATNIAETSLTIDGVRTVVDSGLVRVASFDAERGMNRLDLERVSKASAAQRSGRAGRQAPGKAIRLWSELEQKNLADFNVPEIERVDLCATVLAVHAWGTKEVREFGWFERPSEESLVAAETLLEKLGALHEGALTETGKKMLEMPVHPRVARMLLAAAGTRLLEEAVNLGVLLSDDSRSAAGDVMSFATRVPDHLRRQREQLWNLARGLPAEKRITPPTEIGELLLLAYPDRVCRRRVEGDLFAGVMVGGSGVRLAPEAMTGAIAASPFFLALDAHHDPRNKRAEALVRRAIVIDEKWLSDLFPELMRKTVDLEYSEDREKVETLTRRWFADLVLEEERFGKVDAEKAGVVLGEALRSRARELFLRNEACVQLIARVGLVRSTFPNDAWPVWDETELGNLMLAACAGKKSLAEVVQGHGLSGVLRESLVYPFDRKLSELAPETLDVPSGSKIKLEYSMPAADGKIPPPILAVRLQEMFGLLDTPAVCAGRVKVLLHLLSPGYKPVQVTADLRSFWNSAYFLVKKDLKVKYPKHKWPDDPLTAVAEAKGKPRR